jgi:hypothetical protein
LHPALIELLPELGAMAPRSAALLLFLVGAALIALVGYIVGAVALLLSRRKRAV